MLKPFTIDSNYHQYYHLTCLSSLLLIYNPRYLNHGLSLLITSAKNQREKTLNLLANFTHNIDKEKKRLIGLKD